MNTWWKDNKTLNWKKTIEGLEKQEIKERWRLNTGDRGIIKYPGFKLEAHKKGWNRWFPNRSLIAYWTVLTWLSKTKKYIMNLNFLFVKKRSKICNRASVLFWERKRVFAFKFSIESNFGNFWVEEKPLIVNHGYNVSSRLLRDKYFSTFISSACTT